MNKTLFEIEEQMYNLLEYGVDSETGEVIEDEEEFNKLYDSIQLDIETKLDNSNCLCKVLDGEIEVIDKEIKRLTAEKKSRENKKEWIRKRVDSFIRRQFTNENGELDGEKLNAYKITLPHSKISYRKSDSVNVYSIDLLPTKYIRKKVEELPDKTAIKEDIKNGKKISGANLVTNYNIQVK